MSNFKDIIENTTALRFLTAVIAALFVPAFMLGVVSVWVVVFGVFVALRFREGLKSLNEKMSEAQDAKLLRPRLRFWALVAECILYSYIAFGSFLYVYGGGYFNWPAVAVGLDGLLGFPENFYLIGKIPDLSFFVSAFTYVLGASNSLFILLVVFCFLLARQEFFRFLRKEEVIWNTMRLPTYVTDISGIFNTIMLFFPLLLYYYVDWSQYQSLSYKNFVALIFQPRLVVTAAAPYIFSIFFTAQFFYLTTMTGKDI